MRRVRGALDPKQFQAAFVRWIESRLDLPPGGCVSIDGKCLRGSARGGVPALHLLSACSHELGVVIGQRECSRDKGNEITECPKLLDALKIRGSAIRRIVYNRIKMATGGAEPPSFGKRKCIYDDTFRKQTLFSCRSPAELEFTHFWRGAVGGRKSAAPARRFR